MITNQFYELFQEAVERDLPKDFLLKFNNNIRDISNYFIKIEQEQKEMLLKKEYSYNEMLKAQIRINYKFTCIVQSFLNNFEYKKEEEHINASIISDEAEYSLKELSEILQINYKTCARIFKEKEIPSERREARGYIYLGRIVKKFLQSS